MRWFMLAIPGSAGDVNSADDAPQFTDPDFEGNFADTLAASGAPASSTVFTANPAASSPTANPVPANLPPIGTGVLLTTTSGSGGTASATPGTNSTTSLAATGASGGASSGTATGATATDATDTSSADNAIDNSQFSAPADLQKWAPLVAGLPLAQQEAAEKALNRPIAAAEMLQAGGVDAKTAQTYLDANPAVKRALDTAAHGGKADGNISKNDISSFISTMQKQLSSANDTLSSYQKANPNADGQSLELVREAALLQANLPITNAADPSVQAMGDKETGYTTQAGLQAIVSSNPGLSSALTGAANMFSQPGMFAVLDQGGLSGVSLATHSADGQFNEANITGWVQNQAPTTGGEFASLISDAATRGAVASVDTSNLNGDIFVNPQNYTGAQKAAALVQLQTTQAQVEAGSSLRNITNTDSELEQRIQQLQADPDVVSFLQQSVPQNESSIINSDPALAAAVQTRYTSDVLTGTGLQDDISQVDASNTKNTDPNVPKESDADALNDFSSELSLQSDLRGGNVPTEAQVVAGNSSLTSRLQADYKTDFSDGDELKKLLAVKGADAGDALTQTQSDEQAFESALDPNFIESQSTLYTSTTNALAQPALLKAGSGNDVLAGLSNGVADTSSGAANTNGTANINDGGATNTSGEANPDEIAASIASSVDPATLAGGTGSSPLSQSDVQTLITAFIQDLQSGTSLQDALAKYDPTSKSFDPSAAGGQLAATLEGDPNAAASAHAVLENVAASALLTNSQTSPGTADATSSAETRETAEGNATYGLMAGETTSAFASSTLEKSGSTTAATALGGARDAFGAVGGAISAALTLPQVGLLLKSGQKWEGGLSLGAGVRGSYAAASTSVRAVAAVAPKLVEGLIGVIGEAAGPAGVVIDAALGVAFIFTAIAQAVKKAHEKKAFDNTVDPTLNQYGITNPK